MLLEWCVGILLKNPTAFKMDTPTANVEWLATYYVNLMDKS